MLYSLSIIASGYRETEGLPRCPVCGKAVTSEPETHMADGGGGTQKPVESCKCEHCHADINWVCSAVPEHLEPFCDTGGDA